jgi:hypothetical protein
VNLSTQRITARTRQQILRSLPAEQGFAMRPLPLGHRGLTLHANGGLEPGGADYIRQVSQRGISVAPGGRLVFSEVRMEHNAIVLDINGGPDRRHRFLRHVSVGTGMAEVPLAPGEDGPEPEGARITLEFDRGMPEMTGEQVKALLSPLVDFTPKSAAQAVADTLPEPVRRAVLEHRVLVGMPVRLLLLAKGQPEAKSRELEGQTSFEEWIYGAAPAPVEFVRIRGSRVVRVETARVGETPVIETADTVTALLEGTGDGGQPIGSVRTVRLGDVRDDPDVRAPKAPPTLRAPGEQLPLADRSPGAMKPVEFPPQEGRAQGSGSAPGAAGGTPAGGGAGQAAPEVPLPASGSAPPAPASAAAGPS